MSYAAFDHLTLNFHQALEYYLFMAFIIHSVSQLFLGNKLKKKKISPISKLMSRNSEIMPIEDKGLSNHRGA